MTLSAELQTSAGQLPVIAMALYTELQRFPRLFVIVESEGDIGPGPFTLTLSYGDLSAVQTPIMRSIWYKSSIQQADPSHYLLELVSDPDSDLQVRPFGVNNQDAQALLKPRLGHYTQWEPVQVNERKIEALVSRHESFEQLARRVAGYTNAVFGVYPRTPNRWSMAWAPSVHLLARSAGKSLVLADVCLLARTSYATERELQQLTLPAGYDPALLEVSDKARVRSFARPLQWGEPGASAVVHGAPVNEKEQPLGDLRGDWYALTKVEALAALWQGAFLESASGSAAVLGSLFLYECNAAQGRIGKSLLRLSEWLGCSQRELSSVAQGWAAFVLATPLACMPKDKLLLQHLLSRAMPDAIWTRLLECLGCGYRQLSKASVPAWGPMAAIVVNNPAGGDPIGRSQDQQAYRTKIWVRLLGVDGDLEVDWATPFASYGGNGDLILVPQANTLGYVLFQDGHGAPLFFAMTHYRDTMVSARIQPDSHKHGLVTEGGLILREVAEKTLLQAEVKVTLKAASLKNDIG